MKDLSDLSLPFTFSDLAVQGEERSVGKFISLFTKVKAREESPTPGVEDRARQVFEEAYKQGEKAGYEMGMRRAESVAKRLEQYIGELEAFRNTLTTKHEHMATELAVVCAEAIVLRQYEEDRETLARMIRKALEACEEKSEIVIRVRAEDLKFVENLASHHLRIMGDEALVEPGFVIETTFGDIDGTISTQLDELRNALAAHHG